MAGAGGAAGSTSKSDCAGRDSLPSASVLTAVTVCSPSASASVSWSSHVPSVATVAVPTTAPSIETSTSAPASPVPVTSGVLSFVEEPSTGLVIAGASGAAVSTSKSTVTGAETLPESSAWVAVTVCSPSANGVVIGSSQVPSGATTTSPSSVPSTSTVTDRKSTRLNSSH